MSTTTDIIDLLPINWQALSAMGTFIVAIATFWSLKQYRKKEKKIENKEIIEKIIQLLIGNLNRLIETIEDHKRVDWNWQWPEIKQDNRDLIFRIPQSLKEEIEQFHIDFEKFKNLSIQRTPKFREIIFLAIFSVARQRGIPEIGEIVKISQELSANSYFRWSVGGKICSASFYRLIFEDKILDACIEDSKKDSAILNKEIQEEAFIIGGSRRRGMGKEEFSQIVVSIKEEIQKSSEFQDYVRIWREIYEKVRKLREDLQNFEEKILK